MADSNLNCGPRTVKYLVFLFNLLFFFSGIALITIGGIAQGFFRENVMFFDNKYETPAICLIIIGSIIMIVSFFGCCGAHKENVLMLRTFSGLMLILLVCEVAAVITVFALKGDIEDIVNKNMKRSMQNYGNPNNTGVTETWDKMQDKYDCCGAFSPNDWKNTTFGSNMTAPDSCCKDFKTSCGVGALNDTSTLFSQGCYIALKQSASQNLGAIMGGAIGLVLIQMVGIWMSCSLVKSVRERYEIL